MSLWILWIALAAILLIIEVCTQMVWTLCVAIGCVAALCGEGLGLSLAWQLVLLALASVIAFVVLVPKVRRWHDRQVQREGRAARTGMDALLGRRGVVTHEIKPEEPGRVRIDGDSWQAVVPDLTGTVRRGSEVVVTGYDSIILTVTPYLPDENH